MTDKAMGKPRLRSASVVLRLATISSFILHPSSFGWAAHPFVTDDAGTQGAGHWQIELLAQRDRHDRTADAGAGPVRQRSRSTLFNPVLTYGLLDNLDIALGGNRLRNRVTGNGAVTDDAGGTADSTLEVKWRFHDENGFSLALKPGFSLPTGDEKRGLGTGRAWWGINFIGAYEAKPWSLLGNVSYTRPRYELAQDAFDNRDNLWRVSAGAAYAVSSEVRLTGELGVRSNEAREDPFFPGRHARFAMLGAIYSPTGNIDLDIGLRKGLNHAEINTVLLLGAAFRW